MDLTSEFLQKQDTLISTCRRVSEAVLHSSYRYRETISQQLHDAADVLASDESWDVRAAAANSLREMYHKDGFHDWVPDGYPTWDADTSLIYDYSTIYIESKYSGLRKDA